MRHYIEAKEFDDFRKNQQELIKILNHNMTKISQDVRWIKFWMKWIMGILSAILVSFFIGGI